MFDRIIGRGMAVLITLLPAVFVDPPAASAQDQAAVAAAEQPTFANRFSALTELAALAPAQAGTSDQRSLSSERTAALPPSEPFERKLVTVAAGAVVDKWNGVVADLAAERQVLALCRGNASQCPAAAQYFLAIVANGRAHEGRARIGVINRAINLAIKPTSDMAQWGVSDRWSAPLVTLANGRGDCEDYAIAKYAALREAGVPEQDVRLVIVRDLTSGEDHAVTAARVDGKWIVLDNRRLALVEDDAMVRVVPLFVLDRDGVKRFAPTSTAARPTSPPAEAGGAAPSALGF
jgi:predicted transglutaminase-like cysteine proteinase